ncbi:MAG: dihydrofolate reductase family protein [Chitinophagales bacterium]|nr:dihydrofolate reductase family protein [Chitinophagales bacterium]
MGKLVLFMHTSLDMYTAGMNGEMNWIHVDQEIFEYVGKRVDETDTALYGRVTFEMMEAYWPTAAEQPGASNHDRHHAAWYKTAKKVVLSRSWKGRKIPNGQVISDNIREEVTALKTSTEKDILIFGSPSSVHTLMAEGLIDSIWVFLNPVIIGKGIPLFSDIREITRLKLDVSHRFASGVICLGYTVQR